MRIGIPLAVRLVALAAVYLMNPVDRRNVSVGAGGAAESQTSGREGSNECPLSRRAQNDRFQYMHRWPIGPLR